MDYFNELKDRLKAKLDKTAGITVLYQERGRLTGLSRRARPQRGILHLRASADPARRAFYSIGEFYELSYRIKNRVSLNSDSAKPCFCGF